MAKMIDLVIINPGNKRQVYQSLGQSLAASEPPIWAGLIANFVRKKGYNVTIIDSDAENLNPEETTTRVKEINPSLVAIVVYGHQPSASTQNMPAAHAMCDTLKNIDPERKVIMIGGHVAALPEKTLEEEKTDFVSSGEGLFTLIELIEVIKSKRSEDLKKVRGLLYRDNGRIIKNYYAPLLMELDTEMPQVAWDLLPMKLYRAHNWHCFGDLQREPYAAIYTTLGCPFHCTFCCIQAPFKSGEQELGFKESTNTYRLWSPKVVLSQIQELVEVYGVKNIKFADELFILKVKHVNEICDMIIERKYDLNIWAYARVDTIKRDMLDKLKKAGINWLALGIESANETVRDDIQKNFKQEELFKIIDEIKSAGISTIGNYIFGLPEDNLERMQETLDLAIELNCEFANFYCTMAYPGSQLYIQAVKEKWKLPEGWSGYSQHSEDTLPLNTKYLSGGEVLKFRDQAFNTYFNNPAYLEMADKKFGRDTVEHIQQMVSHSLKRKFLSQ